MELYRAYRDDNFQLLRELIDQGADVNILPENECDSLLLLAAYDHNLDAVKMFVDAGADPNFRNSSGRTSLFTVIASMATRALLASHTREIDNAEQNVVNIIRILIDANADINSQDNFGITPLSVAIRKHIYHIIKFLIEQGADVNIIPEAGRHGVASPVTDSLSNVITLRWPEPGQRPGGRQDLEKLDQNQVIFSMVVDAGADLNIKYRDGNSLTHLPAAVANRKSVYAPLYYVLVANEYSRINDSRTFNKFEIINIIFNSQNYNLLNDEDSIEYITNNWQIICKDWPEELVHKLQELILEKPPQHIQECRDRFPDTDLIKQAIPTSMLQQGGGGGGGGVPDYSRMYGPVEDEHQPDDQQELQEALALSLQDEELEQALALSIQDEELEQARALSLKLSEGQGEDSVFEYNYGFQQGVKYALEYLSK